MGVRGLTTYINYNQDAILQKFFLHDINLVVDGHSLCAQLYGSLNCFSAFGGDYDKFASYTRNFFKNLRKCNVNPYVLFDGSLETRKLRTAFKRLRSKINGASRLDPVTQNSLKIFPLLLRDVFKEVLVEMKVPYTICEFEADDEIAAMARHLNCPVLSYDSDFFIYNVLYIPFNTLESKPQQIIEGDFKYYALECKIYKVENLTEHFGGLEQEMLPLLATLLGNDFVEKRVFNKFFSQLKMPKSKKKRNEQQRCIHALFNWLQNETLDSAVAKIIGRLRKSQKHKVFAIIKKSLAGYSRTHCRSLKYFNIDDGVVSLEYNLEMPEESDNEDTDSLSGENNESSDDSSLEEEEEKVEEEEAIPLEDSLVLGLPDWIAEGVRNKTIPRSYLNLYTHHLHFCSPQAEDYTDEDSFLCTLPILRYAFDIMTDFSHENCIYVSRENDNSYKKIFVDIDYAVPRLLEIPYNELSNDQLNQYFFHFLKEKLPNFNMELIRSLPQNFQLYMIAILWWLAYCNVPLAHVHSLLLCYTMLEVIDEKTGTFRGHNFFNNKYSKKIQEFKKRNNFEIDVDETELFLNKNKVQYEDCLIAANVLLKHFEIDDSIRKKPKSYDIKRMHSFAQFQCCLYQFNCLNTLCREPLEPTKISKSYNGTFIYNIALKLEGQTNPLQYFEQYLKGATSVLMFYKSLLFVYNKCVKEMKLETVVWSGKKRRRRRKNAVEEEVNFIVKGFESEVVI
ncbi:protein asteroid-like [Pectinophora gossypiella]|uniref:protein asteroid-like n=1 Tax=Pectinophora gossypiella TaxID=13191 RepID=UPI00214E11B1|nr:protein asteroid-like [Pectinophora gossypiella]